MKATRILIAQHRAIEALFEELARETRRTSRARAASRLAEELIAHMAGNLNSRQSGGPEAVVGAIDFISFAFL